MTMADSAIDRALAVFRAYAKTGVTGVTGVTGENLPNKLRHLTSVTPVTPIGAQGVTGVTSNNQNKSVASASVTPVTRVTPQKTIVRKEVNPVSFPYADALDRLKSECPEYVDVGRCRQCLDDAHRFLAEWGDTALALGWTADELFGLHEPPAQPRPSYSRLSRYDCTGLIWMLEGKAVVALTATTAAMRHPSGAITTYRKLNKPALGPLGDSLDDFTGGDPPEAA
jgi:hypothetical protein